MFFYLSNFYNKLKKFINKNYNILKMNEEYDVIVLGTGLKECITAGLLAKLGTEYFNCINV